MSGAFRLPRGHLPVMVNRDGFSCAVCRFYRPPTRPGTVPSCANRDYVEFTGTSALVDPRTRRVVWDPETMCSDWFEPR